MVAWSASVSVVRRYCVRLMEDPLSKRIIRKDVNADDGALLDYPYEVECCRVWTVYAPYQVRRCKLCGRTPQAKDDDD